MTELLENNSIGDVVHVNVNFGFNFQGVQRLIKKELGGGTILDIGIYTINAVTMIYKGEKPQEIKSVGHLNEEGKFSFYYQCKFILNCLGKVC